MALSSRLRISVVRGCRVALESRARRRGLSTVNSWCFGHGERPDLFDGVARERGEVYQRPPAVGPRGLRLFQLREGEQIGG